MRCVLKKTASKLLLALAFASTLVLAMNPTPHAADPSTFVSLTPLMHIATTVGETFQENAEISTTAQVHSIEFTVTYNSTLLEPDNISQGSFFPPSSFFTYQQNETAGYIKFEIALPGLQTESGNGTMVIVTFRAISAPQSIAFSSIDLEQILIVDSAGNIIPYNSLGALYFWQSIQPDPPLQGRLVDLYTQRGGIGPNALGGEFMAGETVDLLAEATYNNYPVQVLSVAFQVINPLNQTVAILASMTNESGIAQTQFTILFSPSSEGNWTIIAAVQIDSGIVWDTMIIQVFYPYVVGGYTVALVKTEKSAQALIPYLTVVTLLAAVITVTKRKPHRKMETTSHKKRHEEKKVF